ncbi:MULTISPECIES: FUSC family protein [unclassified Acinetobacter]|uniref:FUSC family protein n=1 Tax=unclassified Acinetobacter TaxID=196816 RepID=UPI001C23382B|nr:MULTISPECIES: FUSC family protein [unclassified Acinetobacter]
MSGSLAQDSDNLVHFQPQENIKLQRLHQITEELEHQSHLFVVILGTVIGAILALFIGYHINTGIIHFILLSILPVCLAYFLRKVYIYTLTHS